MAPDEIEALEKGLGLSLPQSYRAALLANRLEDPLHDDLESLLGINSAFRSGEIGELEWPCSRLAFGHDGGGNYFFFEPATSGDRVFCRDHETEGVTLEADSFEAWLTEWNAG